MAFCCSFPIFPLMQVSYGWMKVSLTPAAVNVCMLLLLQLEDMNILWNLSAGSFINSSLFLYIHQGIVTFVCEIFNIFRVHFTT